ncbi:uncharacterized protein LOC119367954 isoform X2 [Triticum dicoccoides]|uniref:uncharacterized protein LOC119367954 isoform X2 n=1 Tax=Triticum dicoccoides TaxID=85692 RepID=UPI00188E7940|nr:uncharacterized protein LOC119367954 isoform X2 [Triticum dicoccoides]
MAAPLHRLPTPPRPQVAPALHYLDPRRPIRIPTHLLPPSTLAAPVHHLVPRRRPPSTLACTRPPRSSRLLHICRLIPSSPGVSRHRAAPHRACLVPLCPLLRLDLPCPLRSGWGSTNQGHVMEVLLRQPCTACSQRRGGIQTSEDYMFYAISAEYPEFSNKEKTLMLQFTVNHEQKLVCGGGYIKLLRDVLHQPVIAKEEAVLEEADYMFSCCEALDSSIYSFMF